MPPRRSAKRVINNRSVPIDRNMSAGPDGRVMLIDADQHAWMAKHAQDAVTTVDPLVARMAGAPPKLNPSDFLDEIRTGSNSRTLYQSQINNATGRAEWVRMKDLSPDEVVGFELPNKPKYEAYMNPEVVDDNGVILRQFVGSYAAFKRADALQVYWDGHDFYDFDHRYLHCPESFKRGIPSTMGLEGIIYIPKEDFLEDLLITIEDQNSLSQADYHSKDRPKLDLVADVAGGPVDFHKVTRRQVAGQTAKECFDSAWKAACFEIIDCYTMVGRTYEERQAALQTLLRPLKNTYRQMRLMPVMPILSEQWAQQAFENTPDNAMLVLTDPNDIYAGETNAKGKPKLRRKLESVEKTGPLVGWNLDGGGRLQSIIVQGTEVNRSAVDVYEGQQWVFRADVDSSIKYNSQLKLMMNSFKKVHLNQDGSLRNFYAPAAEHHHRDDPTAITTARQNFDILDDDVANEAKVPVDALQTAVAANAYMSAVPSKYSQMAIEAYVKDLREAERTATTIINFHTTNRQKVVEYLKKEVLGGHHIWIVYRGHGVGGAMPLTQGQFYAVRQLAADLQNTTLPAAVAAGLFPAIPAPFTAAELQLKTNYVVRATLFSQPHGVYSQLHTKSLGSILVLAGGALRGNPLNLLEWNANQVANYSRAFPHGSLVKYRTSAGAAGGSDDDRYIMTGITIV